MLDGVFIASIIGSCIHGIKEAFEPTIPAENWANQELIRKDMAKGMTVEEKLRNAERGRYIMTKNHSEPHRDLVDGKIVIENFRLYNEDILKYDTTQVDKWKNEGRYNLSPEELEMELKAYRRELEHPEDLWRKMGIIK